MTFGMYKSLLIKTLIPQRGQRKASYVCKFVKMDLGHWSIHVLGCCNNCRLVISDLIMISNQQISLTHCIIYAMHGRSLDISQPEALALARRLTRAR